MNVTTTVVHLLNPSSAKWCINEIKILNFLTLIKHASIDISS